MPGTQAHQPNAVAARWAARRATQPVAEEERAPGALVGLAPPALAAPGAPLGPAGLLALQRLAGNHAVQHIMAARAAGASGQSTPVRGVTAHHLPGPAVQRYFLHTPQAHEATPAHFEAQEKPVGSTSFLDATGTTPNIQPPVAPVGGGGMGPPAPMVPQLRVSDDGNLAIEGTDLSNRQSKVFFATQAIVNESNARLLEVGSPFRLQIDQPAAVTINAGPINRQLDRVVPRDVTRPTNAGTGFDLGHDRCNEVAEKVTQSGGLADSGSQGAPVHMNGLPKKLPDPEYRLARYVTQRMGGQNHTQAIAHVNDAVDQTNMQAISDAYTGLVEPRVATGSEVKTELVALGVNPRQQLENALGNYLTGRGGGQNHATAAGATLGGLGLPPAGLASIESAYNNLKVPAMAAAILVQAQAVALPPTAPPLPANLGQSLERYVRRRLIDGVPRGGAELALQGIDRSGPHAGVLTAIDAEYTNQLAALPAGLTAAGLADEVERLSPHMRFEYQLVPYVQARFAGQLHAAAVATVPGLSAAVLAQLDQAYNNAQAHHALTPAQRAAALTAQLTALGVNQFAAPEVGQLFGSGFTGLPGDDSRTLNYRTGQRLNASAEAWSSHYGGVVAKSGGDRITLENYARVAENQGSAGGASKEYYFQMYGSLAGQSWHETWSTAGRPVMNAVTLTYGQDKRDVWSGQLAALPPPAPGVQIRNFAQMVSVHQRLIKAAPDVNTALGLYYAALDALALMILRAHRTRGEAVGPGHGVILAPPHLSAVNAVAHGPTVAAELGQWVAAFGAARNAKWAINLVGRQKLANRAARLAALRAKITDVVDFHTARRV